MEGVEEGRMEAEKYKDYVGGEEGRIGRGIKERMDEKGREEEGKLSENGSRGWREQIIHT